MADKLFSTYFDERNEQNTLDPNTKILVKTGAGEVERIDISDELDKKTDKGGTESTTKEVEDIANAALPSADAATVATTGDYNDLNNTPEYNFSLVNGTSNQFALKKDFQTVSTVDLPKLGILDNISDFNTITDRGFYRGNIQSITLNAPINAEVGGYVVIVSGGSDDSNISQMIINATNNDMYVRTSMFTTWTPWDKVAYESNTLKKRTKKIITSTTYQLLPEDVDRFLYFTANTEVTLIVPTGLSEDDEFHYMERGDGQVNPTAASGMVVNVSASFTKKTANKYSPAVIRMFSKTQADVFGTQELA